MAQQYPGKNYITLTKDEFADFCRREGWNAAAAPDGHLHPFKVHGGFGQDGCYNGIYSVENSIYSKSQIRVIDNPIEQAVGYYTAQPPARKW